MIENYNYRNYFNLPEIDINISEKDKSHREKYRRLYIRLIDRCLSMSEDELSGYNEKHHILPKCLNGKNNKENIVIMPIRYHIMAPLILMEIYPNNAKICCAALFMIYGNFPNSYGLRGESIRKNFSTRTISNTIQKAKLFLKGENHPNYGKGHKMNSNTKEKIRKSLIGREVSLETREKLRKANLGKKASEKTRRKMSESRKGKKLGPFSEEARKKRLEVARSEERRRKISLSKLGSKNPNYGKHLSEETKKKLSESNLKRRDEISNLVKDLWESGHYDDSNIHKKGSENSHAKKIVGPDGTIYGCLLDAVEASGIPSTTLRQWMKGLTKNNHGWKYLNPLDAMTRKERKEDELNKNKNLKTQVNLTN